MPSRTERQTVNGLGDGTRKRQRQRADDAQDKPDEVIDVHHASSSLRHESRKRVRVSDIVDEQVPKAHGTPRLGRSPSFADSDGEEDPSAREDDDGDLDMPPATQYEHLRDRDFSHLQHEKEDDQRATQRLRSKNRNVVGENRIADNGILENITCINFMCHERLSVDLGPLLNFVVGENGSGKSAILTAITLCLGGKASSTNRGGSLKSFVKEGQDHAVLIVKIKNQGVDAYKHIDYGDSIIVERHFSRQGSSGFKVRAATGRVVSTKRSEVSEIVEYYCLQVDNPLNVLSQDNARQFLNASSASMKYKFFLQGVQLEQLDKDYALMKEFLDASEDKLPEQQERLAIAQRSFEAADKLRRTIQDNQELRRRQRLYMNQLAWSQVEEQEKILADRENAILEADANIARAEQTKTETTQALEQAEESLRRAQDAFASVQEEGVDYKTRVDEAADKFASARRDLEQLHNDERDVFGRLRNASEQVKDLEAKVRQEEKRIEDKNGDAHALKREELQAARDREAEIGDEIDAANNALPELQRREEAARKRVSEAAASVELKRREIQTTEGKIRDLQQSHGSKYDAYEQQMPDLLRAIEHDAGFKEKPVGPIGSHIQVLQPIWSPILEATLGNILNGFIVTSKQDQERLRGLMERFRVQKSPIVIANRRLLDTSGKEPDERFDTILRVLRFDNELIKKELIINNRIEQVILIQERKNAEDVMFNGPVPQNVVACLALHDGKRGQGLRLTARAQGISTSPVIGGNQRPRMKSDSDSQIAIHKDYLESYRTELRQLETDRRQLQQTAHRCQEEIKQQTKKLQALQTSLRHAQLHTEKVQEDLDQFDGVDVRLQALQEQLLQVMEEKDSYGNEYGEMNVRKKEQNKLMETLKKKLTEEKLAFRDYEAMLNKAQDKVTQRQDVRKIALVAKNEAFEEADKCRDDKRVAEARRDRQRAQVEEFTVQASAVAPERVYIPQDETVNSIQKKYEGVRKQLDLRQKKIGLTDEEVNNRFITAKETFDQAQEVLDGSREQIQALKQTFATRLDKWRIFQRYISANSRTNFIYLLSEREFRGKLLLDHARKRLEIQVEPDATRKTASGRDTKTLSGGEKSFSSICLLLAIWEAMGSPLRCLDEFDVFMDNVNRAISTQMLVDAARRSVSRQYILITPNAITGSVATDKDVKIHRLTDPRQRILTGGR
ncbi:uncharacterized protein E0L32_009211 [Thyridium curvatum]|uniref:RecF/RecN/SMC N-terminal domain-containing protein n=1 Tax=Thyridium curvatum TaxID=1093900 RepID=A0A507AZF1_9PEZI|nr:uncharacterized protein E0L32_009211 [Thyridium curvatum]TPX09610.1 hypothetical protein E0L32_009211 [Thyridium curvatum]